MEAKLIFSLIFMTILRYCCWAVRPRVDITFEKGNRESDIGIDSDELEVQNYSYTGIQIPEKKTNIYCKHKPNPSAIKGYH